MLHGAQQQMSHHTPRDCLLAPGVCCWPPGAAGRSNALNIAERLGLETAIVAAARARLGAGVAASNAAIGRLELVAAQVEGERVAAWAVEQQLGALQVGGWGSWGAAGLATQQLCHERCAAASRSL
jgi:hypothetical protein